MQHYRQYNEASIILIPVLNNCKEKSLFAHRDMGIKKIFFYNTKCPIFNKSETSEIKISTLGLKMHKC